jgi:hypothetical protein
MRSAISKRGGNASRASERKGVWRSLKRARKRKLDTCQGGPGARDLQFSGGQGVHCEVESEGHEEKCRAVINEGYLEDEPVGQRWDKVEPALRRRRRSHSPTAPRCLRMARHGRAVCDLRKTDRVPRQEHHLSECMARDATSKRHNT